MGMDSRPYRGRGSWGRSAVTVQSYLWNSSWRSRMKAELLLTCVWLAGSLFLAGCGRQQASIAKDAWYTGLPPGEPPYYDWSKLDSARVHEVVESRQPDAEELLRDVAVQELTTQQAEAFIGGALPDLAGTKPYLTRGLVLNRGLGRFTVYVLEDQLLVHHSSLGSSPVPMTRQALVLQLEQSPKTVSVYCKMAE